MSKGALSKVKDGRVSKSATPAPQANKSPSKTKFEHGLDIMKSMSGMFTGDKATHQADEEDEDEVDDGDDSAIEHDGKVPAVLSTADGIALEPEEAEPQSPAKLRPAGLKGNAKNTTNTTASEPRATRNKVTETAPVAKTKAKATKTTKAPKTTAAAKPDDVDPSTEYEVEKIVNLRVNSRRKNQFQYEVKWKGYKETTWEGASNVENAQEAVEQFHKANPNKPKSK